jgi:hypothetical protein
MPYPSLALLAVVSVLQPAEDATKKAAQLFQDKHWVEARAAYDTLGQRESDRFSPSARKAVERAIECSLKLEDWEGAVQRAERFATLTDRVVFNRNRWHSWNSRSDDARRLRQRITHLELSRYLFRSIAEALAAKQTALALRQRVNDLRIDCAFNLVDEILGEGFDLKYVWHPDNDWWYALSDPLEKTTEDVSNERVGIPLAPDGEPRFVRTPKQYNPGLGPGEKVLFLLKEITDLDGSSSKNRAARALLKRALIARQLYGPTSDEGWDDASFYYYFDQRPSFKGSYRGGPVRPHWQLDDDEVRTLVDGQLTVLKLPPSESTLALLRRLERDYPSSDSVPTAIYARGVFYQSRQQFAKAETEYQKLITTYPLHERARRAREQVARLHHPGVLLGRTRYLAAGTKPTLWFAHRETDKVEFTARPFDIVACIRDKMKQSRRHMGYHLFDFVPSRWSDEHDVEKKIGKYLRKNMVRWTTDVQRAERVTPQTTEAPLTEVGAYLVEARTPGSKEASLGIVVLTDLVLLQKQLAKQSLIYVAEAQTGRPVAGQEVLFFSESGDDVNQQKFKTNADGIIQADFSKAEYAIVALAISKASGVAVTEFWDHHSLDEPKEPTFYVITDRPAYRPGSTIFFRTWVRRMKDRSYEPPKLGESVRIALNGPNGATVRSLQLTTDRWGAASGSFELGAEAALGPYTIQVAGERYHYDRGAARFRVEEYKKPEFEVRVEPADSTARVGDKVRFRVTARYYSGEPVRRARVLYEAFRRDHEVAAPSPQPFDWLYGPGYGQYVYSYPWLAKNDLAADFDDDWYRYSFSDPARGQRVKGGQVELNEQGQGVVQIDTATWNQRFGDRDHSIEIDCKSPVLASCGFCARLFRRRLGVWRCCARLPA